MTTLDAVAMQGAGVAAAAAGGWARLRAWRRGTPARERRLARRERTAGFLRSLDLDPDAVLGDPG